LPFKTISQSLSRSLELAGFSTQKTYLDYQGFSHILSIRWLTIFFKKPENLPNSLKTGVMAFMEEIRRHSLLTEDSIGLLSMKYNSLQNNIYS
jgi:hypothetical protein